MEEHEEEDELPETTGIDRKKSGGQRESTKRMAIAGLLAMAMVIGVVSFVVATVLASSIDEAGEGTQPVRAVNETTAPRPAAPTPKGAPAAVPTETFTTSIETTELTTPSTTTPLPEVRPLQFIMCVVGLYSTPDVSYSDSPCDYLIFSDVAPVGEALLARQDNDAWNKFKLMTATVVKRTRRYPTSRQIRARIHFGVSFSPEDRNSLFYTLRGPLFWRAMQTLYNDSMIATYGIFGMSGTMRQIKGNWTTPLRTLYTFLSHRLTEYSPYNRPLRTLFLGIRLHDSGTVARADFQQFIFDINDIVNVLVIETHVTDPPAPSMADCVIHSVSAWNESQFMNSSYLSLRQAGQLMDMVPSSDVHYAFSFTMGVMQYVKLGSTSMLKFRDKCSSRFLVYFDVLCEKTAVYDDLSAMAYGDDPHPYETLYAFEDNVTISEKVTAVRGIPSARYVSWVVFDMHLDTYECMVPKHTGHAFERVRQLRELIIHQG